uniref:Uncharacterized protein n=1 Tax=Rangifer tarandus platyrhynchus TaxID=3082113 RepID=A0ACB0FG32_RANTA|nr:unnamed protein product [Rangifer tarandus platyrhynchus]
MREWSAKVPDPRGSKASTPTREGLAEAWPKPCSFGPRNPVVGQRDPGSERPPPLGGRDEGEVCCGFQWVAVVRALRTRKTEPKLRFLCERRHMQLLDHENIVKVLDVVDTEDSTITVMEYVSRGDMQAYLDDQGHMTEQEAQCLLRQLLSALNHCHEWGIVHWDLKPSNLFLDVDHNVKTADFSLNYDYCPGEKLELLYPMFGNIYGSRWMRRSHSSQSEDGLEVTVQNTSSTRDTLGKNSTQNTKSTRDTRGTRDNSGTQDTRGKSSTQDTRSTCDTRGKSSTRDTSSTRDESSTQDTCGKTSTQDTSGTHDTHGKSLGLLLE